MNYFESNAVLQLSEHPKYSGVAWMDVIFDVSGTLLDISHLNWEADGLLDVVRLYDRALSAEEILQNFNASKWRYKDDMYVEGSTTS